MVAVQPPACCRARCFRRRPNQRNRNTQRCGRLAWPPDAGRKPRLSDAKLAWGMRHSLPRQRRIIFYSNLDYLYNKSRTVWNVEYVPNQNQFCGLLYIIKCETNIPYQNRIIFNTFIELKFSSKSDSTVYGKHRSLSFLGFQLIFKEAYSVDDCFWLAINNNCITTVSNRPD